MVLCGLAHGVSGIVLALAEAVAAFPELAAVALPLVAVFVEAFSGGFSAYTAALADGETRSAIVLTLVIALIALPFNVAVGVAAAWAIAKFDFRGKSLLITLIDLPFAVSPVVVGLVFLLLFGAQGLFGPWLAAHDIKIVFALPAMILVTAPAYRSLPAIPRTRPCAPAA